MLLLAGQQLQLAGNVPSALAALQLADAKLQRLDRPQFVPLRRALARDMDRLKAVPFVDVAGLPLHSTRRSLWSTHCRWRSRAAACAGIVDPARTSPRGAASCELWQDMRQLVRVENLERPEAPLCRRRSNTSCARI